MKNINLVYLLFVAMIMTSCYKDNSATDFKIINPLTIEFGGASKTPSVFQFDDYILEPIVYKNGVPDNSLDFEWSVQGNEYPVTVVGNKMALKFNVIMPPNSNAYDLILTATDKSTGIQARERISMKVISKYGEGLLVADTRDERTSDLSLLVAMNFSRSVTDETAKDFRNIYSDRNNAKIDGLVRGMQSVILSDSRTLTVLTEKSIYRFDPYDFADWQRDNQIFFVPYEPLKPVGICKIAYGGSEYINVDGKMFYRNPSWANYYFNYYMFTSDYSDYNISKFATVGAGYYTKKPYCYDEIGNRFLKVSDRNDVMQKFVEQHKTLPFDMNNIGEMDALALMEGENENLVSVLKSEEGGKYFVYWMQTKVADNGSNVPIAKIDMSAYPDMAKSVGYTTSPISKDFYYATDKKIYTFALDKDNLNPKVSERFEIDPKNVDEKITSIMLWRGEYQGMWVTDETNTQTGLTRQNAQYRMIVITTYNETTKEGKVITMPIIRTGDGTIDPNRKTHIEYRGFGRITSVEYNQVGS